MFRVGVEIGKRCVVLHLLLFPSFLSGRRPSETLAFGFRDSFREAGVGENWTSMPQFFKEVGNFSTVRSFGKVCYSI